MKRIALLLLAVACAACRTSAPPAGEDVTQAIAQISAAVERAPEAMPLRYLLATYYDRAKNSAAVEEQLAKLEELGWKHGVEPSDFTNASSAKFRELVARLDARDPAVHNATRAFTLPQRDLIPEGIAWDPADGALYVSSIYRRKIVRISPDGSTNDFIPEAAGGAYAVLGMKVDLQRRLLWTASHASENMRGYEPSMKGRSALIAFSLGSGAVVRHIESGSATDQSLLNDIALLDDGSVIVTDSQRGAVLRLAPDSDRLEVVSEGLSYANGIAPAGGTSVYVADFMGLHLLDVATRERTTLQAADGSILGGIDGLSRHGNTLIGVQNSIGRPRIIRIDLAASGREVTGVRVLESRNPDFIIPTTGTVAGDRYYFIANSQLQAFTDHVIWPDERLRPVVILQLPL